MRMRIVLFFTMLGFLVMIPRTALAIAEDHEIYIGLSNNHVYDIWWYGPYPTGAPTVWDATQLAGAPTAAPQGGLAAYFINSEFFVYFVTSNDHLGLLYYTGSWHYDDLTSMAGAPDPVTQASPLVGFNDGGHPYVYYEYGTSIAEVWSTGGNVWHWDSPSSLAGAPAAETDTSLTAFLINSERLVYYSDSLDVHELYNNGVGWVHLNVSQAGNCPELS